MVNLPAVSVSRSGFAPDSLRVGSGPRAGAPEDGGPCFYSAVTAAHASGPLCVGRSVALCAYRRSLCPKQNKRRAMLRWKMDLLVVSLYPPSRHSRAEGSQDPPKRYVQPGLHAYRRYSIQT